ncbi:MAG: acylphosphatase [Chloroflexota bacterium]
MSSETTGEGGKTTGAHLLISGRVQGVYFRDSTRAVAERLGLTGWARNLRDGRVEAAVHGAPTSVEDLVRWCHHGPPAAHVVHVERREIGSTGVDGFRVLPTADAAHAG